MPDHPTLEEFKAAKLRLIELTTHTDDCLTNSRVWPDASGGYAPDDSHDHADYALRHLLTCLHDGPNGFDDADLNEDEARDARAIWDALNTCAQYPFGGIDFITGLAIDRSLCPYHLVDWAACFDDDDEECKAIRAIYPCSHDT